MMALDDERLQRIFGRLAEDEVRRLSFAMSTLGRVEVGMVELTLAEFKAEVGQTCNIVGNVETTEKLLRRLMSPEKADELVEQIQGPNGKNIWEKLSHIPPAMLAGYLRNEYPQTAAAILSQLPAPHAARVLRLLPERLVSDVAVRMVRMNSVQRAVVTDIEETLKREFSSELSRSYGRDSTSVMAEILNRSSKEVLERVMAALETNEPEAAARRPANHVHLRRFAAGRHRHLRHADRRMPGGQTARGPGRRQHRAARTLPVLHCRNGPATCCARKWR